MRNTARPSTTMDDRGTDFQYWPQCHRVCMRLVMRGRFPLSAMPGNWRIGSGHCLIFQLAGNPEVITSLRSRATLTKRHENGLSVDRLPDALGW